MLFALGGEGKHHVRVSPARNFDLTDLTRYVGVQVADHVTIFTPAECDQVSRVAKRVEDMPKEGLDLIDAMQKCADHLREEAEKRKTRMI